MTGRERLALSGRLAAGGALAFSGYMKLMGPAEEFALAVEGYRLLPLAASLWTARVLPWAELFAGAALVAGYLTRFAAVGTSGLFLLFLAALGSAAARGVALNDCGCFGQAGPHFTVPQSIALDAVLLAFALLALLDRRPRLSLDAFLDKSA